MGRLSGGEYLEMGLYVLVGLIGGFLLAVVLEVGYATALLVGGNGFEAALAGTLAAGGVIEPVATKLVPALFVAYMARTQVPAAAAALGDRWLPAGVGIGLGVGLMEFATRLPLLVSAEEGFVLAGCALAPALLLHPLMGLLVAAPAFRATARTPATAIRRRAIAVLSLGVLVAMIVHVWWNTGGAVVVAGWIHPTCTLGP